MLMGHQEQKDYKEVKTVDKYYQYFEKFNVLK